MSNRRLDDGDNLDILRNKIASETVDLIYLDPPFNSKASYNVLFRAPSGQQSEAQIKAFDDTRHWNDTAERAYDEVLNSANTDAAAMLQAMRSFLKENDMMAYLAMMAVRLIELHRVLKPSGSLYLHCDPKASHYLKILLDAIFGARCFGAEIIWKRTSAHNDAGQGSRRVGRQHDVIFQYMKSKDYIWNNIYHDYSKEYLKEQYRHIDDTGRRYGLFDTTGPGGGDPKKHNPHYKFLGITRYWRFAEERMKDMYARGEIIQLKLGMVPLQKRYFDKMPGIPVQSVWTDIKPLSAQAKERRGYPTQKPLELLKRILAMSSNEGDVVLDPFCGCGTTVHAAETLGRKWIGIDITHLAIHEIKDRLNGAFSGIKIIEEGTPKDIDGARALAQQDKYQFEWWALSLIGAQPS